MADEEQVKLLRGVRSKWNAWRYQSPNNPNLRGANLARADLHGADLHGADLTRADLTRADLSYANLTNAYLFDANLSGANLAHAELTGADPHDANLSNADLSGANLHYVNLHSLNLSNADLTDAYLSETVFANVDLTSVIGLETCIHRGPSIIDHRTLQKSGPLPIPFLRGIGLPDRLIEYLPSLLVQGIQYYSCFISYSAKDQEFADRIHADLQNKGVRCWFAPHDLPIGEKILDGIDAAIRLRDKVLLILSEHSIRSEWSKMR